MHITRNRFEVPSRTSTLLFMHSEKSSSPSNVSSSPSETRKEERKFRRFPVEIPCFLSADGPEWNGMAFYLSREGCSIRRSTPFQRDGCLCWLIHPSADAARLD